MYMTNQSPLITGLMILALPGMALFKNGQDTRKAFWLALTSSLFILVCTTGIWTELFEYDVPSFIIVVLVTWYLKSSRLLNNNFPDDAPQPLINIPDRYREHPRKAILWVVALTTLALFDMALFFVIYGALINAKLI